MSGSALNASLISIHLILTWAYEGPTLISFYSEEAVAHRSPWTACHCLCTGQSQGQDGGPGKLASVFALELMRLPLDGRDFFLMVLLMASLLMGAQVGLGETMKAS